MGGAWRALSVGLFHWAPAIQEHSHLASECMISEHRPPSFFWQQKNDGCTTLCFVQELLETFCPVILPVSMLTFSDTLMSLKLFLFWKKLIFELLIKIERFLGLPGCFKRCRKIKFIRIICCYWRSTVCNLLIRWDSCPQQTR